MANLTVCTFTMKMTLPGFATQSSSLDMIGKACNYSTPVNGSECCINSSMVNTPDALIWRPCVRSNCTFINSLWKQYLRMYLLEMFLQPPLGLLNSHICSFCRKPNIWFSQIRTLWWCHGLRFMGVLYWKREIIRFKYFANCEPLICTL